MKIAVAGKGHIGLSNAGLLTQRHEVWALDIVPERVAAINSCVPSSVDAELEDFLKNKPLQLTATVKKEDTYRSADLAVIATPTDKLL